MLSIKEYQLLLSCVDDSRLFYFLFKSLNEGYIEKHGPISTTGTEIATMIVNLINLGFLDSWRVDERGIFSDIEVVNAAEFKIYADYACRTFEEHLGRYGNGPHEFEITNQGLAEVRKPSYNKYAKEVGIQITD